MRLGAQGEVAVKRTVHRRKIGATGFEIAGPGQIDLRQVAWAAAVETMQVNLVARGWVELFGAMLDPNTTDLVWRGQGPGERPKSSVLTPP